MIDNGELKKLLGDYLNARSQEEQAFTALCSKFFESGIPQAQTELPGTPLSLTVEQMAKELHISETTAYSLVKQDDFPAFRIRRKILVNRMGLQWWMDEGGTDNVRAY